MATLPNNPARSFVLVREGPPDCHHVCAVCAITAQQMLCPGKLHVLGAHRESHDVLPFLLTAKEREPWHRIYPQHEPTQKPPLWWPCLGCSPTPLRGAHTFSPGGEPQPGPSQPRQDRFSAQAGFQVGAPHPLLSPVSTIPTGEISLEIGLISERGGKN